MIIVTSCQKENSVPIANFTVKPSIGDYRTVFYFDARKSSDVETLTEGLEVKWDWENDGIWDTNFTNRKQVVRRFTTDGNVTIRMQIKDYFGNTSTFIDSIEIWKRNTTTDVLIDQRDGSVYPIVKFKDNWIMQTNLRFGIQIQDSCKQSNNSVPEYYYLNNDSKFKEYGGLYSWDEAMNYNPQKQQGICPDGWHIPDTKEWVRIFGFSDSKGSLRSLLATSGIPINIDYYYGKESYSALDIDFYGKVDVSREQGQIISHHRFQDQRIGLWTSDNIPTDWWPEEFHTESVIGLLLGRFNFDIYASQRSLNPFTINQSGVICLHYIRCFKDI